MTVFLQAHPSWLWLHKLGWEVTGVMQPGVRLSITSLLTRSQMCIIFSLAWHTKLSQSLDQTCVTVKLEDSGGGGQWYPFTIVLTGYGKEA